MTEKNTYPTTGCGFYGNGSETVFINQHGRAFVVQSPDMVNTGRDAIPVDNYLPVDMVQLGDADCADIEVPEWVYDVEEDED
jgi:hypothetical protein